MIADHDVVFDRSAYPRTYELSVASKWMLSVFGLVVLSLSLAGLIFFSLADAGRTPAGSAVLLALCGAFALLGIYLLVAAFFYRVVLQAAAIQVFEIYRRRYLARGDIEGRTYLPSAGGSSAWVLVPKSGGGGKIKLSTSLKTDDDFRTWIESLRDLDLEKKRADGKERTDAINSLLQRGFADSTVQRLTLLARGINWAVYGLGLSSFFVRDPDHVLTWAMIALPWVAILLVAHFAPF